MSCRRYATNLDCSFFDKTRKGLGDVFVTTSNAEASISYLLRDAYLITDFTIVIASDTVFVDNPLCFFSSNS